MGTIALAAWLVSMVRQDPAPKDPFPIAVGTAWKYTVATTVKGKTTESDLLVEITGTIHMKDGDRYVEASVSEPFVFIPGDEVRGYYVATPNGIVILGNERITRQPGTLFKFPLKKGDRWEWKDSLGVTASCTTEAEEDVGVPAGKYRAFKVTWRGETLRNDKFAWDIWLAPGVGVVKYEADLGQGVTTKVLLKSHERESARNIAVRKALATAAEKRASDATAAVAACDEALKLSPRRVEAYELRARIRTEQGDIAAAMADLNRALELDPNHPGCRLARAQTNYALGALDDAVKDATAAIDVDPKSADAFALRASLRTRTGQNDGAIEDLTKAIALREDPLWYATRGELRKGKGDKDGARDDYRKALVAAPKDWRLRGKVEEALKALGE